MKLNSNTIYFNELYDLKDFKILLSNKGNVSELIKLTFEAGKLLNLIGFNELNNFVYINSRSQFSLCPRGYGLNSFRLYEAFQLGAIPVIITDRFYLPWEDEINWADIAVLIEVADIPNIKNILLDKSSEEIEAMQSSGKRLYEEYFTLDGVCNNILKRLR